MAQSSLITASWRRNLLRWAKQATDALNTTTGTGHDHDGTNSAVTLNGVRKATLTLTTAQIKALYATPLTLVAAPGASKYIKIDHILLKYTHVATAYTLTSATVFEFRYTDASGAKTVVDLNVAGVLDQTSSQVRIISGLNTTVTPVANAVIVLGIGGANPTLGDGTAVVEAYYRVIS